MAAADIMPVAKLDRLPPPEGMSEAAAAIDRGLDEGLLVHAREHLLARYCESSAA